ncbi:Hsp70 family protein [Fusarium austroafricanum]|uniref:Hsp70 family protein n=1 Tax=Fusarium austroafricanum TaxID=2364996 RepID=A0A8H4KIU3_9HYPO|nr:Hsp70 family protein [Fusarium austroafricanum]
MNSTHLDLRVGVDFGTTYTGVSWNAVKEKQNKINIITEWPGAPKHHNKVPTVLAKDESGENTRWGFLCKDLADDKKWKLFKLLLDPVFFEKRKNDVKRAKNNGHGPWIPETIDDVYILVDRYLSQVYIYISNKIPELIKNHHDFSQALKDKTWASMKVEFIFSTPTTWEASVSQWFRRLVSKAGFGGEDDHSVILGLTEAEAAAVFTCQSATDCEIRNNNILLSIDAGGGTTDIAFVRKANDYFTLEEIRPVTGIGVGSTKIDNEFAQLIEARINQNPTVRSHLPKDFALKASQSQDFQNWKHNFGSEDWNLFSKCSTRVAEAKEYTNDRFRIEKGELFFTSAELKSCFDKTLKEIKEHIQTALQECTEARNSR